MPNLNTQCKIRRFLAIAKRILGLVLLILEILKQWHDLNM